jgi:phage N-6-adenine-methyltransferase
MTRPADARTTTVRREPVQKPGRSKQDYGTPPELLAAVKARLQIADFVCDLAATRDNAVAHHYCTDAFAEYSWNFGPGWNWLNPPYGNIEQWVKRAYLETRTRAIKTAVLIPAAVGSNWWRDWVHGKAEALFLNPRITFVGCVDPYPKDCALLLYRPVIETPYDVWTWKPSRTVNAVREVVDAAH